MRGSFKTLMMASVTTLVVGVAHGQTSDVEARISALEDMIAELKAELDAEKARSKDDVVRLERKVEDVKATGGAGVPASGMMVGDTNIKVGGFIDFDAHVTHTEGDIASNSIARDFYIPGSTPVGGNEVTETDFTAQASRFFISGSKPVGDKTVSGYFELDFLGSAQGNELVSSSFSPRLRRAYIDYGSWRVGQEWSTFQNTSAIPESASFLALSDGMVFVRQAQIRYSNGPWQFALENPNTTTLNIGSRDENVLPDLIARYNMKGDYGNVSLAAIGRQLRVDQAGMEDETFGWGLSAAGRVKVGEKDDIRFNLTGGEGLGRYIGLAASRAAAMDANGDLEAITSYGGLVAWRHPFGETARFNVGYSGLWVDNPDFLGGGVNKSVQSGYAAVLWDVAPKVTLGTEILYGKRELENGDSGEIARFTFSTKYAF